MSELPPQPLYTFRGNMNSVLCILPVISDKNELVYVGTESGHVHVWDLKLKREKIKHVVGREACLCILVNNEIYFTHQKGDSIKFWSENTNGSWKLLKIIKHDYSGFCRMDLYKHNIYLANCATTEIVMYNFVNNCEKTVEAEKSLGLVMCLKVIISLANILVCYESGIIIVWNTDLSVISQTMVTSKECPMAIDFCEETKEGILGTNDTKLFKFSLHANQGSLAIMGETVLTNPGVSSIAINKEGKLCVVGCWDSRIRYYSMKKLTLLAVLIHHNDTVESVCFINKALSFCGKGMVVAGGKDSRVSLWNLYTDANRKHVKNKGS